MNLLIGTHLSMHRKMFAADKMFRALFSPCIPLGFNRHEMSNQMKELAGKLHEKMFQKIGHAPVTMCVDGWTNTRHRFAPFLCLMMFFFM